MFGLHNRLLAILVLVLLGTSAGLFLAHEGIADHGEGCDVCLLAHANYAEPAPSTDFAPAMAETDAPPSPPLLAARPATAGGAAPRAPPAS